MTKSQRLRPAIAALCMACPALAIAQDAANPVQDFYASCIGEAKVTGVLYAGMSAQLGDAATNTHEAIFAEALACNEEKFRPAVADAGENVALAEAVKEYYVAVRMYLATVSDTSGGAGYKAKAAAAGEQLSPASEHLLMEAKLAGKMP